MKKPCNFPCKEIRDGPNILFSIWYPVIFSYPVSDWIPIFKKGISSFRTSGQISGKLDINKTFLLLYKDLRCFNYLSNSVVQRTGIEISGIRPGIRNPVLRMARYPVGLISGKTAIRSIPNINH